MWLLWQHELIRSMVLSYNDNQTMRLAKVLELAEQY